MKTTDVRVCRAITAVAAGHPVVLIDDTAQDSDGYLVFAAEAATPRLLTFTIRHTSGYVRVALPSAECERLNLPPMCHRDFRTLRVGRLSRDRHRDLGQRSRPDHRGTRRG